MSRWRPPAPKSSPYITPEGYAGLEKELASLWKKRRIVNDALSAAAAEGDRSENAEYIYRKKEQAGIDRRIRYLQKRLPDIKVIDKVGDTKKIYFGSYVTLEIDGHQLVEYRIVGPDETDASKNHISIDSPLAKSLLGKNVNDEVDLIISEKKRTHRVLKISYELQTVEEKPKR